jgi:hypothetical protein
MPRYYKNLSETVTADNENLKLNANGLDVQNTGTTAAFFDSIYIAPGTGRKFPHEIEGEICIYEKDIEITFEDGTGELIVNQFTYSRK